MKEVQLCYLGDVLVCEAGVERAVRMRVLLNSCMEKMARNSQLIDEPQHKIED